MAKKKPPQEVETDILATEPDVQETPEVVLPAEVVSPVVEESVPAPKQKLQTVEIRATAETIARYAEQTLTLWLIGEKGNREVGSASGLRMAELRNSRFVPVCDIHFTAPPPTDWTQLKVMDFYVIGPVEVSHAALAG